MQGSLVNVSLFELKLSPADFYVTLDTTFEPYSCTVENALRSCGYNFYSLGLDLLVYTMG